MSEFVVDSSVAVKWFVPEDHSDAAVTLLDDAHELYVPDLLFPEFGNILWKKIVRDELALGEALTALEGLEAVPLHVHPTAALIESALRSPSIWVERFTTPWMSRWRSGWDVLSSPPMSGYTTHCGELRIPPPSCTSGICRRVNRSR